MVWAERALQVIDRAREGGSRGGGIVVRELNLPELGAGEADQVGGRALFHEGFGERDGALRLRPRGVAVPQRLFGARQSDQSEYVAADLARPLVELFDRLGEAVACLRR